MHIFVALRLCIRFQNHRHTQPIALGKGNVQHLSHIDSPFCLIFARNKRFSHAYADSACPAMAVGSAAKTGLAASCDHS